jgi:hypothetical protein
MLGTRGRSDWNGQEANKRMRILRESQNPLPRYNPINLKPPTSIPPSKNVTPNPSSTKLGTKPLGRHSRFNYSSNWNERPFLCAGILPWQQCTMLSPPIKLKIPPWVIIWNQTSTKTVQECSSQPNLSLLKTWNNPSFCHQRRNLESVVKYYQHQKEQNTNGKTQMNFADIMLKIKKS